MIEISFSGRGGQGVVIASQILGMAFFKAGDYPQCYSVLGGERRGAPLASFLRVDNQKILLKCEIKHPNEFLCFDDSLLDPEDVKSEILDIGPVFGTDTDYQIDKLVAKAGRTTGFKQGRITQLNATLIVNYGGPIAVFTDQIFCEPILQGGDSGSIIVNPLTNEIMGLGFAGSDKVAVFNKIQNVEEALQISL